MSVKIGHVFRHNTLLEWLVERGIMRKTPNGEYVKVKPKIKTQEKENEEELNEKLK